MAPCIPSDNEPGRGTRGTALASLRHPTGTPSPQPAPEGGTAEASVKEGSGPGSVEKATREAESVRWPGD